MCETALCDTITQDNVLGPFLNQSLPHSVPPFTIQYYVFEIGIIANNGHS